MVIGVSGVAGAGKDLFVEACMKELSKRGKTTRKFAIATALKEEVRGWCLEHYNVDPVDCLREDKEKIRSFLVLHGTTKRRVTQGRHWVRQLDPLIKQHRNNYDYLFVSDVRYNDYLRDEVHWIKNELNGALVHVSQYEWSEVLDKKNWPKTKIDKVFLPPANAEEERNDPTLKAEADHALEWERVNNINKDKYISSKVVQFIEWLDTQRDGEERGLETYS